MRSQSNIFETVDPLPQALLDPAAYPHPVYGLEIIETHISWVVLTGEYAYKIKKPVELPFADFSTLSRRRFFCEEELRLNRRFAPELYLGVVPVAGTRDAPRVAETPAIEYAVKLRQFPESARLDRQLDLGSLDAGDARQLGEMISDYQSGVSDDNAHPNLGSAESIGGIVLDNLRELEALLPAQVADLAQISAWTEQAVRDIGPTLLARKEVGFVREGHGDLHLENLVRLDGERIVPFDALEFNVAMRWLDTVDEVAFLAMDLMSRGRADLAWVILNRYFESNGDYAGLDVLRFYLVYRALVRAKVCVLRDEDAADEGVPHRAAAYLDLAGALTRPARPLLILTHGLSGSGKTTISEPLIGALGAVRVRSDLERKRLHGLAADAASGSAVNAGLYDAAATEETYDALEAAAEHALRAGFNVIVDAAFLKKCQRERFRKLAASYCARRVILDCRAPVAVLRERISARTELANDASEATNGVLSAQIADHDPLCWDEQCSQVLVDSANGAHVATLVRQILSIGRHPLDRAG